MTEDLVTREGFIRHTSEISELLSKAITESQMAEAAFNAICAASSYDQVVTIITELTDSIEKHDLDISGANFVFGILKMLLDHPEVPGGVPYEEAFESALSWLEYEAKDYFIRRIINDARDHHIADILINTERILEESSSVTGYLRDALEFLKERCEKEIERQRKRVNIMEDLGRLGKETIGPRPWGVPDARGYMSTDGRHYREWEGEETKPESIKKGKANKNEGELTVEQSAIFFHYFFQFAKVSSARGMEAKKIAVIKSVTRWSGNSISNIVYDKKGGGVFRKSNGDDYEEFEADMHAVRKLYQNIGLQNVVTMIDSDLEDIGQNL